MVYLSYNYWVRFLFILTAFLVLSCNDMRSKRSEGTMRIDSSSENVLIPNKNEEPKELEKVVDLGYYDTYEKLPKLTFVKIPEKDFLKLEQKNYVVTQNPSKGKDCFYIQTAFEKHKYNN